MLLAPRLKEGDTIGIISPSKPLNKIENVVSFCELVHGLRLRTVFAKNAKKVDKYGFSAGSIQDRVEDIHEMFNSKSIHAIWCAQGGGHIKSALGLH